MSPEHPVWLNRLDGHMYLANSLALRLAGINNDTKDIPGGTIVRNMQREPMGILKDNATNLVTAIIPPQTREKARAALDAAMTYVAARGVTKVHTMVTVDCACGLWPKNLGRDAHLQDMELAYEELAVYEEARREGKLRTRVRASLPVASWERLSKAVLGLEPAPFGDPRCRSAAEGVRRVREDQTWLQCTSLKAMIDGSLGTHTAAFFEPYLEDGGDATSSHGTGNRGNFIWDQSILERYTRDASANGLQVCVHAIGDAANRAQLDLFVRVAASLDMPCPDLRFRIEHAQHVHPADIKRFGDLGVIASVQPSHLADDGRWAESVIGRTRMRTSWPLRSLLDSGAVLAMGSDWFVTEPSPLQGIYAAVTRRTLDGQHPDGLVPEEKISVEEALIGYTLGPAFAAFEEHERGSLSPGKLADLVLLDCDLTDASLAPEAILSASVLCTTVGGVVVHHI